MHDSVLHHPRSPSLVGQRPFVDDSKRAVVPDAAHVTALRGDYVVKQSELSEAAVQDITMIGLQMLAENVFLIGVTAAARVGRIHAHGDVALDLEMRVQTPEVPRLAVL